VTGLAGLAFGGALYGYALLQAQNAINNGCTQTLDACRGNGRAQWLASQSAVRYSRWAAGIGGGVAALGVAIVLLSPSAPASPPGVAVAGSW
jgi:hypothetical protein